MLKNTHRFHNNLKKILNVLIEHSGEMCKFPAKQKLIFINGILISELPKIIKRKELKAKTKRKEDWKKVSTAF